MVKTPGKWIKNLLLGKKSSKSNLSKKRDISSTNKGEVIVSSEVPTSNSAEYSSPISPPTSRANAVKGVDSINGAVCRSLNDGVTLPAMHEDGTVQVDVNLGSQEELGRVRHEQAATKAQAAFRGYLARRAFRILKGIIRFQALIQGHLVRRQAVSTLYCVQGIVKFQALVRGHKVRCSDIGLAVHNLHKVKIRTLILLAQLLIGHVTGFLIIKFEDCCAIKLTYSPPNFIILHML
ncbi:protein IQ-DOMAIN 31-like [Quillaja saponaria]|uniref:Protein IQ-DOMAIN 31-like n=1 Tax=Quillaja saponaria TaxID=32244 RepID=A0AAD7PG25_QUISA|nr:protein IQ-DOMAIN 31-like [Quillaja saponaria]